MKKPVVLLTTGTRGDLQPSLALAIALREAGLLTRLASDPAFAPWANQYNLPFTPVEGNPSELMTRPGSQSALTYDGNLLRSLRASLRYLQAARPVFHQMLHSAWKACQGARAVVVSLPTLWGVYIAEALDIPCINALMQPLSRTAAFPCSLLPFRLPNWPVLNSLSYFWVEQALWLPWRGLLKQWLRTELHLPPSKLFSPTSRLYEKGATVLYAISPSVIPRPVDWPVNHQLTGYWFLDPNPTFHPPAELVDFLAAGPPPLYFGFGSGGLRRQQACEEAIVQALERSAFRAVIHFPPQTAHQTSDTRRFFITGDIPHSWLFPQCAGAVHHGGAGTIAAALRAGIPSLVVPQAADQFFWASRVQSLKAGPDPIPQHLLDVNNLSAGLSHFADEPALAENARRLSAAIQLENGVQEAVSRIRDFL